MGSHGHLVPAEINVPELDAEHRDLYRHLAELHQALTVGAPNDLLCDALQNVAEHARDHFSHEESALRAAGYTALDWHKQQHDTGRKRLRTAIRGFKSGDRQVLADLLVFLERWLPDHIAVTDRMAAAYLRNFERSAGAKATRKTRK